MKKLLSILLALMMIMSLATTAFADETAPVAEAHETTVVLHKLYETIGQKDNAGDAVDTPDLFPNETLNFTATFIKGPKTPAAPMTIAELDVAAMTGTMKISLPAYDEVGVYTYEIAEDEASKAESQGVTYSTNKITVQVLVEWNTDHTDLISTVRLTQSLVDGENNSGTKSDDETPVLKNDTFTNKYDVGHLDITKTVSGNLASQEVEFKMLVTFKSTLPVVSDIILVDSSTNKTSTVAYGNGWTEMPVPITVKHGETVHFYNIPEGVTYTVVEDASHKLADGATVNPNSAHNVEYKCTGEVTTETAIASNTVSEVKINNEKSTSIATGVITESAPYIVLIAVCAVAAVLFIIKRRNAYDF